MTMLEGMLQERDTLTARINALKLQSVALHAQRRAVTAAIKRLTAARVLDAPVASLSPLGQPSVDRYKTDPQSVGPRERAFAREQLAKIGEPDPWPDDEVENDEPDCSICATISP